MHCKLENGKTKSYTWYDLVRPDFHSLPNLRNINSSAVSCRALKKSPETVFDRVRDDQTQQR